MKHYFTKSVEDMIDPMDVGTIHFMQSYSATLPVGVQNYIIKKGAKKNPYMGFVVEPYSFFLNYEIIDIDWAQKQLPDKYELVKTKVLDDDEPKYYCIFGCFNVHCSAFWGTRMEVYLIAKNTETNLISWIIVDYHTNTVGFDEERGLAGGNTSKCVFTTNYEGKVLVDIQGKNDGNKLVVEASLEGAPQKPLYSRLWIEGNLSISYGKQLSKNKGESFAVYFNPEEMMQAKKIEDGAVDVESNTWYKGLISDEPVSTVCFPFAQHFLSDSPGHYSNVTGEKDLENFINTFDFDSITKYSSKKIKKAFIFGNAITFTLIIVLIFNLIIK